MESLRYLTSDGVITFGPSGEPLTHPVTTHAVRVTRSDSFAGQLTSLPPSESLRKEACQHHYSSVHPNRWSQTALTATFITTHSASCAGSLYFTRNANSNKFSLYGGEVNLKVIVELSMSSASFNGKQCDFKMKFFRLPALLLR